MSSSVGKRQRERQKVERAQAKAERKAERQAAGAGEDEAIEPTRRTEAELIDDLRALQQAFGDGKLSADDFQEQRDRIQEHLERLSR